MQSEREYTERGRAARAETCKTQCLESTTGLREVGEAAPRDAHMSTFLRIPRFECGEVRGQTVYYHAQGCDEKSIRSPTLSPQPWASILPVAVPCFTIPLLIDTSLLDNVGIVVVIVA